MPSTNNRLKVCTFNAKCDDLDNKCCVIDHCYSSESTGVPDSLKAVMLSINLLPHKADIYNIQNVDKCVVPHLLKELCRVKVITDRLAVHANNPMTSPGRLTAEEFQAVCDLNNLTGLCPDGVRFRDALLACGKIRCLNYTEDPQAPTSSSSSNLALSQVYKYTNIGEYEAYHNGCVLTLVKKSLQLCPTAKDIPCVDSLVLFFEYEGRRFVNVNVNLGGMSLSVEGLGCKKEKVDAVVYWLHQYKDCGSFIVSGAMGDLDYDIDQLLYRGDALLPEFAQLLTSKNIENGSAPSSFPCDPSDPVYQFLEYLLKTCNAEHIPYSWLLQYLRVNGYKKCCAYNLVHGKKDCGTCKDKCKPQAVYERGHGGKHGPVVTHHNRAHLRAQRADRCGPKGGYVSAPAKKSCCKSCERGGPCEDKKDHHKSKKSCCKSCEKGGPCKGKPDCEDRCVPANNKCIKKCKCVCKDKECCVPLRTPCKPKKKDCLCWKQKECDCCDTPFTVKVDLCQDFCDKKCFPCKPVCKDKCKKKCCKPCKRVCEKKCKDVCDCLPCKEEECPPYCDTLSVLKRDLCLYNTLNKVEDVNNRFTGYYDHYNKCLDCRYPRGIFQAWAMCEEYCLPTYPSRKIDNNSELLALDHILVSDCIKNYVSCSHLSELKLDREPGENTLSKNPFLPNLGSDKIIKNLLTTADSVVGGTDDNTVPDYSGVCVESFFPNRVYCVDLNFPCEDKCGYECGIDLYALGIKSLWCTLDRWGTCEVSIETMKEFCLDTHPFFETFFYNTLRNKFLDKNLQGRYDRAFGVCRDNDIVLRCRKKDKITECEFYDLMTCQFSNAENKDRFVITVGFLECVVKAVRCKLPGFDSGHCENINRLYDYLDVCFTGKLRLKEYLESYLNITCGGVTVDVENIDTSITFFMQVVAEQIACLAPCLIDNCRVMEVLIRRAAEAFDMATWEGKPLSDLSPSEANAFQCDFYEQNMDFFNGECTKEDIIRKLPPRVASLNSIRYLIEHCVKKEEVINFLMNVTVGDVEEA